jgi:hypothetical protein
MDRPAGLSAGRRNDPITVVAYAHEPDAISRTPAINPACVEAAIAEATLEERCEFHRRYEWLNQAQARLGPTSDFEIVAVARWHAHELANLIQRLALRRGVRELIADEG